MPRRKTDTSTRKTFPSLTLASDLIPEYTDEHGNRHKWEIVEDVPPSKFKIGDLKFISFLKKGERSVTDQTMRQRAVAMKGNLLGLSDAKRLLAEQEKIPQRLQGLYIVFLGTVLRDPSGDLRFAYLLWFGGRWCLGWYGFTFGWGDCFRFACSESC